MGDKCQPTYKLPSITRNRFGRLILRLRRDANSCPTLPVSSRDALATKAHPTRRPSFRRIFLRICSRGRVKPQSDTVPSPTLPSLTLDNADTFVSQETKGAPAIYNPSELSTTERFWRDQEPWLDQCGYVLRPRYRPGWSPSWVGTKREWYQSEDGFTRGTRVMDARRKSDGAIVGLKKVAREDSSQEINIGRLFSSGVLVGDRRNHCVPVLEVLESPELSGMSIVVMPLLRLYNDPSLQTVGEAVEFFRQLIEGLQFMHERRVAHLDCHPFNIMMDPKPMYPKMYHPANDDMNYKFTGPAKRLTRTVSPVKYLFIDFGLSRQYNLEGPAPRETRFISGDKTIPEFKRHDPSYDPFLVDVYCVGNIITVDFLKKYRGLEFMQPLISDMVQDDPNMRPTMAIVACRFEKIQKELSKRKLRKRLVREKEHGFMRLIKGVRHVCRTFVYVIRRIPPLPTPSF